MNALASLLLQIRTVPWYRETFRGTTVSGYIWFGAILLLALLLKRPVAGFLALIGSRIATRFSDGQYGRLFRSLIRMPLQGLVTVILLFIAFTHIDRLLNSIVLLSFQRKEGLTTVTLADLAQPVFLFLGILFTTLALSRIIDFIYRVQAESADRDGEKGKEQLLPLVKDVAKVLLWAIAFFWTLGVVFHVDIAALIAGLGIGGVAIALAAKESVENLFASFTILADKPFQIDDTIRLGSLEGKVERIRLRSTQLRHADGSLYIIPNKKLVNENLENLTQRDTRGVKVVINLKYGIAADRLDEMIGELKTAVQRTLHVIEPVAVSLETFNENVFQLVMSYHVPQAMAGNMNRIKQEINLKAYGIVMRYTGTPATVTAESTPAPEEAPTQPEEPREPPADE